MQRVEEYVGKVEKCPHCGAVLQSMSVFCPSCGNELKKSEIDKSVKEFFDKLSSIESMKEEKVDWTKQPIMYLYSIGFFVEAYSIMFVILFIVGEKWMNIPFPAAIAIVVGLFAFRPVVIETDLVRQKKALIETFVIPNNKESIFEFLMLASSQIKKNTSKFTKTGVYNRMWNEVWRIKIRQAVSKGELLLANDSDGLAKLNVIKKQFNVK